MATLTEAIRGYRKKSRYPKTLIGKLAKVLRIPAEHVEVLYKRSVRKVVEPEPEPVAAVDYSGWTRKELYAEAKAQGLAINSRTSKAGLLKALKA